MSGPGLSMEIRDPEFGPTSEPTETNGTSVTTAKSSTTDGNRTTSGDSGHRLRTETPDAGPNSTQDGSATAAQMTTEPPTQSSAPTPTGTATATLFPRSSQPAPEERFVASDEGATTETTSRDGWDVERSNGSTTVESDRLEYRYEDGDVELEWRVGGQRVEITVVDGTVDVEGPDYEIEQRAGTFEVEAEGFDYRDRGGESTLRRTDGNSTVGGTGRTSMARLSSTVATTRASTWRPSWGPVRFPSR
ncbi:hypothetical protein VB773_22340 [Haloarculaceae archaeon H-GB2-1]|nr:hypothetical protein [Haloarculaceae archaeon H-GB11]MEA5410040.1 hypothetical protein [Haloarculaceae archaeon H-GB2-1]